MLEHGLDFLQTEGLLRLGGTATTLLYVASGSLGTCSG